ncbi:hypothetical protein ACQR16_30955 [Bradyrhizobium oligotrophicum]|uniref:hypothetical protein n=1 Tax=Bradyrhizobium oligotrophicum TaxID=44255 RepID=UPI003EBFB6AF
MFDIFARDGKGWPGFPKRSYAKLDQVEPLNAGLTEAAGAFCLDVVDADWHEFASGGRFDLSNTSALRASISDYWSYLFQRRVPSPLDPYASAPIYRIEISANPGDAHYKTLADLNEDEWILVELVDTGIFDADVFGALLQQVPVPAHLRKITRAIPQTNALNIVFSPDTWSDAQQSDIEGALSSVPALQYLIGIDVRQGAAIGLAEANQDIGMYFDLGGGVYRNAATRPTNLQFCWRKNAPIVLSHWDADHWSGHTSDPKALARTWIAPKQNMTTKHIQFANKLLRAGGTLHIWGNLPANISISLPGNQELDLRRCDL